MFPKPSNKFNTDQSKSSGVVQGGNGISRKVISSLIPIGTQKKFSASGQVAVISQAIQSKMLKQSKDGIKNLPSEVTINPEMTES